MPSHFIRWVLSSLLWSPHYVLIFIKYQNPGHDTRTHASAVLLSSPFASHLFALLPPDLLPEIRSPPVKRRGDTPPVHDINMLKS